MKTNIKLIFPVIVLALGVLYAIQGIFSKNLYLNRLKTEYSIIPTSDSIEGVITDIKTLSSEFTGGSNHAYLTLNHSLKFRISTTREVNSGFNLNHVLTTSMHLKKNAGSDTISIFESLEPESPIYHFVLLGENGYPRWHPKSK